MKTCSVCHVKKNSHSFHKNKARNDGLEPRCKECRKRLASANYRKDWFKNTIRLKRSHCKAKNIPFDLEEEYLKEIWTDFCPITGKLFVMFDKTSPDCPNLDRINSNKGYIKGNVQYINARINRIKDNSTTQELRDLLEYLETVEKYRI